MSEKDIQNQIRAGVNDIAVPFRANVGKLYTTDGRMIATGKVTAGSYLSRSRRQKAGSDLSK